jgi:hypothetical protein
MLEARGASAHVVPSLFKIGKEAAYALRNRWSA